MKKSGFDDYIKIIIKKIESISPQLIIVEGNIDQKYKDFFSENKMNISLIGGCNIKKLNKIARCVNSFVLPSPDLIGKQVILGSCSKFKVQIIKQNLKINKEQRKNIIGKEYYLMRFEGCGKFLYNTVVLTGPNREELKELKILMKTIIKTARFLYCQNLY
jgi:Icc-related predicted phosphoesterase